MAKFFFGGVVVDLPAVPIWPKSPSRDPSAWMHGDYSTVRLLSPVAGVRVHTGGRAYPGREASSEAGAWVALGDVIESSSAFASSRSLPTDNPSSLVAFTRIAEVTLAPQIVINVGLASPKFGGSGGGAQGEYVSGPPLHFQPLRGKYWHNRVGNA